MLEIENLTACYGESNIIPGLTLSVPDKEIVCLVGRNGVGKSTTLKSIMGLVKTPQGSIKLAGEEIISKKTTNVPHLELATFHRDEIFSLS